MPITQHDFDKHLASIKTIVKARNIRLPSCFISYAWEVDGDQNEKLQTWLKKLKQDLETVGIETFLDICQMNGDMRECMQENIRKSDYILLIGTERFKSQTEEDRLYKTSRDTFNAYKKLFVTNLDTCIQMYKSFVQGKAVVLIEEQRTKFIAFIENGKVLLETPIPQEMESEFSRIIWLPKDALGIYIAEPNKAVYEIIDQAKKEINFKLSGKPIGNNVTNVAFEFGFALEKKEHHPNTIIPLLCSGDFGTSFPDKIRDILIRDMRDSINYYDLLIGLNNPLGIIPAMCSKLARNEEYKALFNSENLDKPEVKYGRRSENYVMHDANISPDGSNQELDAIIDLIFNRMNNFLAGFNKDKDIDDLFKIIEKIIEIDKLMKNYQNIFQNQSIDKIHENVILKLNEIFNEENFYKTNSEQYIRMNKNNSTLSREINKLQKEAKSQDIQLNLPPIDVKKSSETIFNYTQGISKIIETLDPALFFKFDKYKSASVNFSQIESQYIQMNRTNSRPTRNISEITRQMRKHTGMR